jgi:hypothetical protein
MEETVKQVIAANPTMRPGDVFATNDPYAGGSHLPDITVVTPVFGSTTSPNPSPRGRGESERGELLFFTANRAHHAEIGGMSPGSMPPLSKTLADEGVLIRNLKLIDAGESRFDDLRAVLLSGKYPTRDVETNLADVAAQVAANRQGANDLLALVERYSWPVVRAYMDHIQSAAERKVRTALSKLPRRESTYVDYIETAAGESVPIAVRLIVHGAEKTPAAAFDFAGTGPVIESNLNANRAIVTAAVIYVLRLLIDEDIPLNHGVLRPIEIILPLSLLNPSPGPTPETSPAMAAGNVETSQRVVDVLLGALGIAAASQGTMNNRRLVRILRDHLRRQRSDRRRARRLGRPGPHDQYAADRSGGARTPLSSPLARVLNSPRLGRCRPASRRRWDGPPARIPAAAGSVDPQPAPRAASAVWPGRRRARSVGPQHAPPRRRPPRNLGRHRPSDGLAGRRDRDRDPRRRRIRSPQLIPVRIQRMQ